MDGSTNLERNRADRKFQTKMMMMIILLLLLLLMMNDI
jgi:predicted nucleic acid-binding Zn ribbon protein